MSKILIVDDALYMRKVIGGILESGGYKDNIEAANGEEALHKFEEDAPDLVLLDITMPNMDGIEVLQKMRAMNSGPTIVMCSAIEQSTKMMRAISLGASEYIVKPFTPDDLLSVIKKVIG